MSDFDPGNADDGLSPRLWPSAEPPPAIDSRGGWQAAVLWALRTAMAQGARRIVAVDPDFADWPLDEPALLEGLTDWLRLPQRRLVMVAAHFDGLPRRSPRFEGWRAPWAHAIEGWVAPEDMARDLPTLLTCDAAVSVRLVDTLRWRGTASCSERLARQWCEQVDALLLRCERGLAVRTLGL